MRLKCHPCNETVPVACAPQTRDLLPPYPVRAFVAFGDEVVDPRGENAQRHRAVGADARSSAAPNLTRSAIVHHNRLMINHVHEARCSRGTSLRLTQPPLHRFAERMKRSGTVRRI